MTDIHAESASGNYPIRAVDRVCDILDVLANSESGASLSEVATATGVPKSSTFRYLSALEKRRYVERDLEGTNFRLGIAFRPQRTHAIERLTEVSRSALEALRDRLAETVNLGVLDGTSIVHTAVHESPHMMRLAARVGDRGYLHSTALGKALCATLPPARVSGMLDAAGMPRMTEYTITSADEFQRELGRVSAAGYGLDNEENQLSGRCVAVLIPGLPFAAGISVSAPTSRFPESDIARIVAELQATAEVISDLMEEEGLPELQA